jgi:carboxylesterase type B
MFFGNEFLSTVGAVFTGYDGTLLPRPIYEKLCSGEMAANARVPLMTGSNLHEWRFFQASAFEAGYNATNIVEKYLKENVPGYASGDSRMQECVRNKVLSKYSSATDMQDNCSSCSAWYDLAPQVQLATDLDMTLGAILQSQSVGGTRFRYLLDVEAGNEAMGSAHGWEIYYLTSDPASLDQSNNQFSEEKKALAKQVHEYWTTFAKTGVPTSPNAGGPEWSSVEHGSSLPMMRLQLPMVGGPVMQTTNWFSDETAALFQGLSCGDEQVQQDLLSGCGESLDLMV